MPRPLTPKEAIEALHAKRDSDRMEEEARHSLRTRVKTDFTTNGSAGRPVWLEVACYGLDSDGRLRFFIEPVWYLEGDDFGRNRLDTGCGQASDWPSWLLRSAWVLRSLLDLFETGALDHLPTQEEFDEAWRLDLDAHGRSGPPSYLSKAHGGTK